MCVHWSFLSNNDQTKKDNFGMLNKRKQTQVMSIIHKILMKKTKTKWQCTHLTTKEMERNRKILWAKLLCTAYCTRKRKKNKTKHPPSSFSPSITPMSCTVWKLFRRNRAVPKITQPMLYQKLLHLDWVSLHRTHECEILETTLNIKKAM